MSVMWNHFTHKTSTETMFTLNFVTTANQGRLHQWKFGSMLQMKNKGGQKENLEGELKFDIIFILYNAYSQTPLAHGYAQ